MGLNQKQFLIGGESSFSHLSEFLKSGDNPDEGAHSGSIDISTLNLFAGYGISNLINLYINLPLKRISQNPDEENNHHRTEKLTGIGDTRFSLKWIIRNQYIGPGWRLFIGSDVNLLTGEQYELNPFADNADSVKHRHFALGTGASSAEVSLEAWYRSEFPFILGVTIKQGIYSSVSEVGYDPGLRTNISLHAIRQRGFLRKAYPYFKLSLRMQGRDEWSGVTAPNSGGSFIDGMFGLNLELGNNVSGVLNFDFPVWESAVDEQLDAFRIALSLRKFFN